MVSTDTALAELLSRLKENCADEDGWRELYAVMWPYVLTMSYRALGDVRILAEDAAQESFIRLAKYYDFGKGLEPRAFRAYMGKIAKRVCADYLNRSAAESKSLELTPLQQRHDRGAHNHNYINIKDLEGLLTADE